MNFNAKGWCKRPHYQEGRIWLAVGASGNRGDGKQEGEDLQSDLR